MKRNKTVFLSIKDYVGFDPGKYKRYFDLENDLTSFPDLFGRAEFNDDIDSKTKIISPSRTNKLISALLLEQMKFKMEILKEEKKKITWEPIEENNESYKELNFNSTLTDEEKNEMFEVLKELYKTKFEKK